MLCRCNIALNSSWKVNFLWCSFWLAMYAFTLAIEDSLTENAPYLFYH
nr:hypothetical protein [Rhodopirellula sp. JC737]